MNGDYLGGSSNEDGEERLRTPRLILSQREKRVEKKGECQEIYVRLIVTVRWIRPWKKIEGEVFLWDEYYFRYHYYY